MLTGIKLAGKVWAMRMKTTKSIKEAWIASHPHLNPDYITPLGPQWSLTPGQEAALQFRDDAESTRQERMYEAIAGIW
jgi:hypothetical protein